jgi:small-conductance mechanosensitive channel/CRP-like cAMP-binding protein
MGPTSPPVPSEVPHELLLGIAGAALLAIVAGALLPRGQRVRARQGAVLLVVAILCFAVERTMFVEEPAPRGLVFASTFFLLASIGRSLVVLLIEVRAARRTARPVPRIFRDLSTAAAYLAVALLALRAIDVEPGSILTTSALLTAVVGLAMQDTLGNLVSGLALQLQRPFDVGDWVEIDGGQQAGRIAEVTWRATTIMTVDHVEVILPNAGLAKASIRNYSRPSPVARRRVIVTASPASAPAIVHDVLIRSVAEVLGVLTSPQPSARTRSFGESAIEYEVLFFIDDFERALVIEGAVRDRIYYGFARNGIEMPFPTRTLVMSPPDVAARREATLRRRCAAAMGWVPLLQPLPPDAREVLVARASLKTYGPGEAVVRKGEASLELFLVERGTVAVELPRNGDGAAELARLGPGQCFGEMGLLTGEPRAATVRAVTLCDLVVIDRDSFHQVLGAHPEVVDGLGNLLARRQAEISVARAAETPQIVAERSRRLISQIREFFKLV